MIPRHIGILGTISKELNGQKVEKYLFKED